MADVELSGTASPESLEKYFANICFTIPVNVFQEIHVWRRRHQYTAFPRHDTIRKIESLRKYASSLVTPIVVLIPQQRN
jgi:hypothetical protein